MKILIAVDSFKGTLTSKQVAEIIKDNVFEDPKNVDVIAIADGGEGTVDSLMYATNGNKQHINVQGAFGESVESYYCLAHNNETAIVEIALSSGLGLYPKEKLNPLKSTSFGLGETIKDALNKKVKKLVVGIGGSSTNDGGTGMLQALGAEFYDKSNNRICYMSGEAIGEIDRIDLSNFDKRIKDTYIEVACDVTNPLLGENGCSLIYSNQKGADEEMKQKLENNMMHFSKVVEKTIGKDLSNVPGVGAAGGIGFALLAFLQAYLLSGLDVVADATRLEDRIKDVDLVVTGEGSFDHQSLNGKAPTRIAYLAKKYNKRVVGIFGLSSITSLPELFDSIYQVVPTVCTKSESLKNPKECLTKLIRKVEKEVN